jgi:hypothetical protein
MGHEEERNNAQIIKPRRVDRIHGRIGYGEGRKLERRDSDEEIDKKKGNKG